MWKSCEFTLTIILACVSLKKMLMVCFCDLHFQLALRAGHEKDEETADTVGCCSLRVEHISKYTDEHYKIVQLWISQMPFDH